MIELPAKPGPTSMAVRILDFGGYLEPSSGAQIQRINRLGTRHAFAVQLPPMKNARDGRIWSNRLVRGMQEGVRMRYSLLDFYPGTPGTFVVDGAGQAGKVLVIKGGTPGYAFYEGQPFSLEIAGQHYFDFIAAPTVADASGDATITLSQILRAQPADGDKLHISEPMIEGFLMGDPVSWELALDRTVGLSFEIHEAR